MTLGLFWLVVHSICGQGLWNFILMFKDYFLHTSRITVYFVKVVRSKMIESCVCLISGNSTAKRECVVGTLRSVIKNPIILFFFFCFQCGSGRSVAPIKAGFVARVGRRNTGT